VLTVRARLFFLCFCAFCVFKIYFFCDKKRDEKREEKKGGGIYVLHIIWLSSSATSSTCAFACVIGPELRWDEDRKGKSGGMAVVLW
jgi:hypothetical protein